MIVKYSIWFYILLIFVTVDCDTQGVCNRTSLVTNREWEPYTRRKIETYLTFTGRCYNYGCTRTRWRFYNDHRLVTKTKIDVIQSCCLGYIELERNTNNITCAPICIPACKNAYCRAPGECACNKGYVRDPHDVRNCLPSCPVGACENGACIAPNTCSCNFGYTMTNGTCQPVCTEPCNNGTCVAPETCECHVGYRKSNNNICEPYCSTGCENGTCVGPETCLCNPGFRKDTDTNQSCAPICTDPCDNGTCVAPDTCQCLPGYDKSDNDTCQPICSEGCDNGTCVAPETCRCNPGFANITDVCEPVCSDCGNGTCIGPETCQCFSGYEWNSTCVPKCTEGCFGGECVSPDVCQCEPGWEYKNGTCEAKCRFACGNGTCIRPEECLCFNGYHLDVWKLLKSNLPGAVCVPSCVNCTGTCVAPNTCLATSGVTDDDDDFVYGSTIDDDFLAYGSNGTPNDTDDAVVPLNTSDEPDALKSHWLEQHWIFIAFPVLLIVIIAAAALVAFRWRFIRHYIKGDSYTVQGNIADAHRTSSFVDVSFAALEKKDITEAKY